MPAVLTASRIQQSPLDAPAPVTVIDRQTIEASGFTEVQDLLRLVPGFQMADWYGGSPVVTNHGFGSAYPHNLLVMLDGQSVVDPIKGSVDWTDLPIRVQDIERIEVVRGPNQASYGAGAYDGVINIITRTPGEAAGGEISLSAGLNHFRDEYVRFGRRGDSTDWRVSASDRRLDAFDDNGTVNERYKKYVVRQTLMANVVHRLDAGQELDFNLGLSTGKDERGSGTDLSYPYHDYSIDSQFLEVAWRANYSAGSETSLRYAHYGHQQSEAYLIINGGFSGFNSFDADTSQDSIEFKQIRTHSPTVQSVWGLDLSHDSVKSPHYFFGQGDVEGTSWEAYGNLDWRFSPDWLLHVGGMLEEHYNTGTLFSPRLALNYSLSPKQSLRISVGRGYRAPTLVESDSLEVYNASFAGSNGNLVGVSSPNVVEPEKVKFAELGYVGNFDELGLKLDGRIYTERYDNYLNGYMCRTSGVSCLVPALPAGFTLLPGPTTSFLILQNYMNGGSVRANGLEFSIDWHHPVLGRLLLGYSLIDLRAWGSPEVALNSEIEKTAPEQSFSLLWSKSLPWRMKGSVGYYHVDSMQWLGDGDFQPSYDRIDLHLAKSFGRAGGNNEVGLTLREVTGRNSEFRYSGTQVSLPMRQAFVTLKLGF